MLNIFVYVYVCRIEMFVRLGGCDFFYYFFMLGICGLVLMISFGGFIFFLRDCEMVFWRNRLIRFVFDFLEVVVLFFSI